MAPHRLRPLSTPVHPGGSSKSPCALHPLSVSPALRPARLKALKDLDQDSNGSGHPGRPPVLRAGGLRDLGWKLGSKGPACAGGPELSRAATFGSSEVRGWYPPRRQLGSGARRPRQTQLEVRGARTLCRPGGKGAELRLGCVRARPPASLCLRCGVRLQPTGTAVGVRSRVCGTYLSRAARSGTASSPPGSPRPGGRTRPTGQKDSPRLSQPALFFSGKVKRATSPRLPSGRPCVDIPYIAFLLARRLAEGKDGVSARACPFPAWVPRPPSRPPRGTPEDCHPPWQARAHLSSCG